MTVPGQDIFSFLKNEHNLKIQNEPSWQICSFPIWISQVIEPASPFIRPDWKFQLEKFLKTYDRLGGIFIAASLVCVITTPEYQMCRRFSEI